MERDPTSSSTDFAKQKIGVAAKSATQYLSSSQPGLQINDRYLVTILFTQLHPTPAPVSPTVKELIQFHHAHQGCPKQSRRSLEQGHQLGVSLILIGVAETLSRARMNKKRYRHSNLLLDSSRLETSIDKLSAICHIGASFRTAFLGSSRIGFFGGWSLTTGVVTPIDGGTCRGSQSGDAEIKHAAHPIAIPRL